MWRKRDGEYGGVLRSRTRFGFLQTVSKCVKNLFSEKQSTMHFYCDPKADSPLQVRCSPSGVAGASADFDRRGEMMSLTY